MGPSNHKEKLRVMLVIISLFFFVVEIWEPSTEFVRAQTSLGATQQVVKRIKLAPLLTHFKEVITNDESMTQSNFFSDSGTSHSSNGIAFFELNSLNYLSEVQNLEFFSLIEGFQFKLI